MCQDPEPQQCTVHYQIIISGPLQLVAWTKVRPSGPAGIYPAPVLRRRTLNPRFLGVGLDIFFNSAMCFPLVRAIQLAQKLVSGAV